MSKRLAVLIALSAIVSGSTPAIAGEPTATPSSQGRFIVHCQPSARGYVDPIQMPGMRGMSHLHDFFGPTKFPTRTLKDLATSPSTCSNRGDKSAYWIPALYRNGKAVSTVRMQAYYQVNNLTKPYPKGFVLIAGSVFNDRLSSHLEWECVGNGSERTFDVDPTCRTGEYLMASIEFPSCSNGRADSEDHSSHVVYADVMGSCPSSHPLQVPQLTLFLQWSCNDTCGASSGWSLDSGGTGGLHADFASGWSTSELTKLISRCKARDCGVTGTLPRQKVVTDLDR